MKKYALLLITLIIISILAGCASSNVMSVEKVEKDKTQNVEISSVKEDNTSKKEVDTQKNNVEENVVYKVGDRVIVNNKFALTIIAVKETDERNEFSDKKVKQVIIIDYIYENLAEDKKDVYISEMNFKFIDEGGNMCDTYPVSGRYSSQYTPVGAKTLSSMTIGTVEESQRIKLNYYDNFFDSRATIEFEVEVGDSIEPLLEGETPIYENMFNLGDTIEIKTTNGNYTLSIISVELISERNQFSDINPKEVYRIKYTYSNTSKEDGLYISDMDFRVIDENGNMAFSYPGSITNYPKETIKGAKCTAEMIFGTHTEGNTLILLYTDNMFSSVSDLKILLSDIKGKK